jgi:hypothetical protein
VISESWVFVPISWGHAMKRAIRVVTKKVLTWMLQVSVPGDLVIIPRQVARATHLEHPAHVRVILGFEMSLFFIKIVIPLNRIQNFEPWPVPTFGRSWFAQAHQLVIRRWYL